jgi:hypothetical protein
MWGLTRGGTLMKYPLKGPGHEIFDLLFVFSSKHLHIGFEFDDIFDHEINDTTEHKNYDFIVEYLG